MCPQCGAATRTFVKSGEASNREGRGRFATTRTIFKILAAVTFVSVYTVLALPPRTALRPLQSATSDLVVATIGYTSFPLSSISATPFEIPLPIYTSIGGNVAVFTVNQTQQLTINALYMNTTANGDTGTGRAEDVTANCTYQSSNTKIATVAADGRVLGVAPGTANIIVSYAAVPGSANISSAAEGKVPITITINVPVTVSAVRPTVIAEDQP